MHAPKVRSALWAFARIGRLDGWRADLASAALGAVAAAALPPVHAIPVLLICVPGLLALIDGSAGPAMAARRGFWFGMGHHVFGLYWVTEAILVEAARFWWLVPFAVPGLALLLAPFIAAACAIARVAPPGWQRALALAGAWTLSDLAREFVLTGFPWNPWGSVWAIPGPAGDVMLQPAAWVGVPGLTLLTLLVAATPALGRRAMLMGAAGLVGWAVIGAVRFAWLPIGPGPGMRVVLVQGDIAEGQKWSRDRAVDIFRHELSLTAQGAATLGDHAGVIVWPETASPFLLDIDANARTAIEEAAGGRPALVGSVRFDRDGRPRNSLFVLHGDGPALAVYDKWHLVPFGEYQPSWMPLPIQVVPGGGFASGEGPATLQVPGAPAVGPLICYEAIFPGRVVDAADRPFWLVNVTNDAWFGDSAGPRQHLAAARLRAIEEGLPLLRAANTGITAAFDARGHELGRLPMQEPGFLVVELPGRAKATLFALGGLNIPGCLALVVLIAGTLPWGRISKVREGR